VYVYILPSFEIDANNEKPSTAINNKTSVIGFLTNSRPERAPSW
jgi:hypothetical protein